MVKGSFTRVKAFVLLWSLSFVGLSHIGYSLINVQGLAGMSKGKMTLNSEAFDLTGTSFEVSAILDPIPLVPVGVGLDLVAPQWKEKADENSTAKGLSVGGFVTAWSPISLLGLVPFAKMGMRLYSVYEFSGKEGLSSITVPYSKAGTGWDFSIGLKCSLIPFLKALFQVHLSGEKFSEGGKISGNVAGIPIEGMMGPKLELSTTTFSVGIEAGI